jgi:hypothetical protein
MRFLLPAQLLWALAALVPLVLYLFRRKPRRVPVSSLLFFKSLAREHQESSWLRRLKRLLSLLLTLLVILSAAAALARMVAAPSSGEVRSVVIVLDCSASMAAKDVHGVTRLAAAVAKVRERLDGLPGGVPAMLITFDRQAGIAVPRTYDRRLLERALKTVSPRPVEGDAGPALRLARQVAPLEQPGAIWFVSDAPAPTTTSIPPGVRMNSLTVPLAEPRNAGITAFDLRRLPLENTGFEAFVQLQGTATKPLETKLEVRIDDTLTAVRELTIQPGGHENLLLPVTANEGHVLSLRVVTPGDQLAADDTLQARLPAVRPLKVLWISPAPDAFTQIALTAISHNGDPVVFNGPPDAWPPKEPVDVAIFQKWLPKAWPTNLPVIVIDPPGTLGPVQAVRLKDDGLPVDQLRATRERHPLLYGVATARLALTQTVALTADGPLEPLWTGPAGPVLTAGDAQGQRVVVLGFAPEESENLPLSASYPLLIGNAVQWVSQPLREVIGERTRPTGLPVALHGRTLRWMNANGSTEVSSTSLRHGWAILDRVGLWQTDAGDAGGAALLSARETLLPGASAESPDLASRRASWLRGDLTLPLIWLILAILLVESWLFHRHAVH